MTPTDASALDVALLVGAAFEQIGVDYFLGGSLASSLQGEPRSTNDIDFVMDLGPWKIGALVRALGSDFDVDPEALRSALAQRGSWNIFYTPVFIKIDLFSRGDGAFDAVEFERRQRVTVRRDGSSLFVKSPEDSVLRKLVWYRDGGEVSAKQWRDVVEVLRVGGETLEQPYLDAWSKRLDVTDLLIRARHESSHGR